jgi:hypothetical protein
MKLFDKTVDAMPEEVVVIPRQTGDLIFKAKPVLDYSEFDALCPRPKPKLRVLASGEQMPQTESKDFQEALSEYATRRFNWMILKSLEATPGLQWDTVKMDDPNTWAGYEKELGDVLSSLQVAKIIGIVIAACGLDENKIAEATKSFLAGQAVTSTT